MRDQRDITCMLIVQTRQVANKQGRFIHCGVQRNQKEDTISSMTFRETLLFLTQTDTVDQIMFAAINVHVFTSRVSGRGNRIGPACLSVHLLALSRLNHLTYEPKFLCRDVP